MVDRTDLICLSGVSFVLAGVAAIYWPVALILFGLLLMVVGGATAMSSDKGVKR